MKPIGIVGLGQIGGSLAKALAANGIDVVGLDNDDATRHAAEQSGIAQADGIADIVGRTSTIFCCVSLNANRDILEQLIFACEQVQHTPTITDVASYKSGTLPAVLPRYFISGHPMAGSHGSGFGSANEDLFQGTLWNLVVDKDLDALRLLDLMQVILGLGASLHLCSQAWHDETVSIVSGLPHAMALSLGALASAVPDSQARLTLAAGSFRGATRVLLSDPRFVEDLLRCNRSTLLPLLRATRNYLEDIERWIGAGDTDPLREMIAAARDEIDAMNVEGSASEAIVPISEAIGFVSRVRDQGIVIDRMERSEQSIRFGLRMRASPL